MEDIMQKWEKLIILQDLEYWKSQQKNFSEEADLILQKVERGEKLNELDIFTLCSDNPQQIKEYKKFYNIRKSIKDGSLKKEDLHYLIDLLCGEDKETSCIMKDKFSFLINNNMADKQN